MRQVRVQWLYMALSVSQTDALASIIKPGMRICSFGYPDIIAPPEMIQTLMGEKYTLLEARADSAVICQRHGLNPRPIPDAHSLFDLLGCTLDVYDIVQERGCEILGDLNNIGWDDTHPIYDIALDVGTAEHCFNIAQAMFNMAVGVKLGGHIIHENPFNWGNHGFYNLNPTFFHDFYTANGFELEHCGLVSKDGTGFNVPLTKRFQYTATEINIFAMARRMAVQPFIYPQQSKYNPAARVRAKESENV